MENTNNTETFSLIEMVLNEDLAQAQNAILEKLSEKLANAMGERFEEYAPTIFEAKKAKKDWDGDGKVESEKDEVWGSRLKAAKKAGRLKENYCEDGDCEDMEDSEDVEEGEEQYEKEEKGESEKESGKKSKKSEKEEKEEDEE